MKKHFIWALLTAALSTAYAQNIVKNSSFNADGKKYGPEFRTNGGTLTVFTEEASKNRCGKLEFNKLRKFGKFSVLQAAVWIGGKYTSNNTPGGFACKPNTTYDFSIDIKTPVQVSGMIRTTLWNNKQTLWYGKTQKTILAKIPLQASNGWTTYKGSFKTNADSVTACLTLSIGNDERYAKLINKVGDYILFDNIVIKERIESPASAAKKATPPVGK
ncbi:MAG: hypothetical protein J6Q81_02880 [Lentisphaeria bacterium]|nr:hypothetical protein [Lentisphaeria bacterium]